MIPIDESDQKFLRFRWDSKVYQFNCLPFGLSCAPWVFTKTLKPIAAQLRQLGARLIIYIDDILIMAESETLVRNHVMGLIFLLENPGFIVNHPKSQVSPTQKLDFLGFTINTCQVPRAPPTRRQNQESTSRSSQVAEGTTGVSTRPLPLPREAQCCNKGYPPCPPILSGATGMPKQSPYPLSPKLLRHGNSAS
jgi:hypothetical protein